MLTDENIFNQQAADDERKSKMTPPNSVSWQSVGINREEEYLRSIQQHYDALSEREQQVARVLLLNSHEENLSFSITSLAEEAGVSEATVTRFCRSLGYTGFREFKYHAMKHVKQFSVGSSAKITQNDSVDTLSDKVGGLIGRMAGLSISGLDKRAVEEAADRLCGADTIVFVGGGSAAGIAQSAAAVFQNMGMKAVFISDDLLMFRFIASLTEKDAVVCISNEGYLKTVVDAAAMARKRHVYTVSVTSASGSLLTRYTDSLLLTSSEGYGGVMDLFAVLAAQLAVLNVLQMACAVRETEKTARYRLESVRMTETKRYDLAMEAIETKRIRM